MASSSSSSSAGAAAAAAAIAHPVEGATYYFYDHVREIDDTKQMALVHTPFAEDGVDTHWVKLADVPPYMRQGNSTPKITRDQHDIYAASEFWGRPDRPAYLRKTGELAEIPAADVTNAAGSAEMKVEDAAPQLYLSESKKPKKKPKKKKKKKASNEPDAWKEAADFKTLQSNFEKHKERMFMMVDPAAQGGNPFPDEGARTILGWAKQRIEKQAAAQHIAASTETIGLLEAVRDAVAASDDPELTVLKVVYSKIDNDADHLHRLMTKRPLAYYGKGNVWMLRNINSGTGVDEYLEAVNLNEYLHPAEAVIAAMFCMSNDTFLINNGNMDNGGLVDYDNMYINVTATIVGGVGARMEKPGLGEWDLLHDSHVLGPIDQCLRDHLEDFCKKKGIETDSLIKMPKARGKERLIRGLYVARSAMVLGTYLRLALAKVEENAPNPCRIVITKLGLGEWSGKSKDTPMAFFAGLRIALESLPPKTKSENVESFYLSYTRRNNMDKADYKAIRDWCRKRGWPFDFGRKSALTKPQAVKGYSSDEEDVVDLAAPVAPGKVESETTHLISIYAWDGMSYQGNEYWAGVVDGSMDPATVAATTIPFTGTPEVNPLGYKRFRVY